MIPVSLEEPMALRLNLAWGGGERRCLASLPMAPGLSSFCLGAPHPKVLPSAILHMSISPPRLRAWAPGMV